MKEYKVQPLDLMQAVNAKYHEPFIHEAIEFENLPDGRRFSDALGRLAEAFPLLKCRYDAARNVFAEREGFTVGDILKRSEAGRTALLTESLDPEEKLVQFTFSRNLLAVTVSHLLCDGSGFKKLLFLLCDFYNGKEADLSRLMNREFSCLTAEGKGGAGATVKMLCSVLGGYKNGKIYEKTDNEAVFLVEKRISAEKMEEVHAAAKRAGATLNDVFLTAYARAVSRLYRRKKINLPCTVDLRKYAKGNAGIANLTGTYNLNVKIDVRAGFSESLCDVARKMQKQKSTKNDLAGPMLLVSQYGKTTTEKFIKRYGGMNTSPFTDYTNLGKIDEKKLVFADAPVKNAVGYGGLNKAPYFQLAVSTFRGETTLSGMFRCGEKEREKAETLIGAVAEEIGSFPG